MSNKNGQTSSRKISAFRRTVLEHYQKQGRHTLPWRKTRDPYAILVSEIMLQQTQVDRVILYFERWMKKFPTPRSLARAPLISVLKAWSGLGYNRRAKFLHDASKTIVAIHSGTVPRDYAALRSLPGVGDYTAKAVRVFAHNQPEVLIETNVRAVFLHHFFPRSRKVADKRLLPYIERALKGQEPKEWYAALMDYGTHLKRLHPNPSHRSKHHTGQSKFEGSLRQVRGAILRATLKGTPLHSLKRIYKDKFFRAYESLKKDTLI